MQGNQLAATGLIDKDRKEQRNERGWGRERSKGRGVKAEGEKQQSSETLNHEELLLDSESPMASANASLQSPKTVKDLGEMREVGPRAVFADAHSLPLPLPCNMVVLIWEPYMQPSFTENLTLCGVWKYSPQPQG